MAYKLERYQDLPVVVCVLGAQFDPKRDIGEVIKDLKKNFDEADQPIFYINDMTDVKWGFSDVVLGMGAAASAGGVMRHKNLREIIVISKSELVRFGVGALGQAQYGGLRARIANTLDEALNYVRGEVKKA
ncbi:MAG: hypothetical protein U0694_19170 [Anaerolineae bacterium]